MIFRGPSAGEEDSPQLNSTSGAFSEVILNCASEQGMEDANQFQLLRENFLLIDQIGGVKLKSQFKHSPMQPFVHVNPIYS